MKCKLLIDQERGPTTPAEFSLWEQALKKGKPNPLGIHKAGTIIDHKDAHYLVKNGQAVPADKECQEECGLTDEEIAERLNTYRRLELGQLTGNPALDARDEADEVDDE